MVEITKHAVRRFKERFAACTNREAREMLLVVYRESVRPPKYVRRKYPVLKKMRDRLGRYHRWSGLLLLIRPGTLHKHCIVTVISIPFPR
jgi:hypothetical protein